MASLNTWSHPVNWQSPVEEEISFRTEIITSRDGTEQRIAQRVNPRLGYRWQALAHRSALDAVERRLGADQGRELVFAHPRSRTRLTAARAVGVSTLTVPTPRPSWIAVGLKIVLIGAAGPQTVTVTAVSSGTVTFTPVLAYAFAANDVVCEAVTGRFEDAAILGGLTDQVARMEIAVDATPGTANYARSFAEAESFYDGLELFEVRPDWTGGVNSTFKQARELYDMERGVTAFALPQSFTTRSWQAQYWVKNDAGLDAILGPFYRARGAQRKFYAPAWMSTITPVLPHAAGVNLAFAGRELYDAYVDQPMYRHVYIRTTAATYKREVSGIAVDGGGNSVLVLTSSLPAITAASFIDCQWLLRCRFETDVLALEWVTDTVATATFTLRALEETE